MRRQINAALSDARQDALEAMRLVRTHARDWKLAPNRIGMVGFSAGALTTISVVQNADPSTRPDIVAPIYGSLFGDRHIPTSAPPAFIAAAADDASVSPADVLDVFKAWRTAGAPVELHIFESGLHGFGTRHLGKSSDIWLAVFDHWLAQHGFEPGQ